ncbi:MAG: hypothetical protein KH452_04100 [Clostridiales bacterium]|nr:hypothetical protein [Clostridiales bacterium]
MNRKIIVVIFLFIFIFLIRPYVKAEILTYQHKQEFENLTDNIWPINAVEFMRVIDYSSSEATIYCDNSLAVFVCYFHKNNDTWELVTWKCIWARYGNADEWFYPYYPHCREREDANHIFR